MSIRTLTARLAEEASEAHRRQNHTASRALDGPLENLALPERQERGGQGIVVSGRGHIEAGSVLPPTGVEPETTPARRVGIRLPKRRERWSVPGGIAARFGLQTKTDPASGRDIESRQQTSGAAGSSSGEEALPTASDGAPQGDVAVPEQEEAAPITIELQSH